jgi:tetratricopeptide (TPR) repeat protein
MATYFERLQQALRPEGYELLREIASGGMGTVFVARETALNRLVAIKIVRPELATAKAVDRFLSEARILADLRHPNIVRVFRAGTAGGFPYYAMEYLGDGETLGEYMQRERLSREQVLALGRDLLHALESFHRRGVVHRDIKPQNIFLIDGRAVLVDFGIATPTGPQTVSRERSDIVPGTPSYMPPEQRYGWDVGPQTDIYAVGMVLYETLSGRRWRWFLPDDVPSWSGVPWLQRRALRRALAFDVDDRWPDAAAFRRPWWHARTIKYRVRTALLTTGGLAAGAVIFGIIVGGTEAGPVDVAIVSFGAAGGVDPAVAAELAWLTERTVSGQVDAQAEEIETRFLRAPPPDAAPPEDLLEELQTRALVRGGVASAAQGLIARVEVVTRSGTSLIEETAPDIRGIACKLAPKILRSVGERVESYQCLFENTAAVAMNLLLEGEEAFRRQDWEGADSLCTAALAIDPTLAWARWRRANARRWLRKPFEEDLALLRGQRNALLEIDRLLLEAWRTPFGEQRIDRYTDVVRRFPFDPYGWLVFGDDLQARGPLLGLPRDTAQSLLERAVVLDSTLGPALLDLTILAIRRGDSAAAAHRLEQLGSVSDLGGSIPIEYLQAAKVLRFGTSSEQESALYGLLGDVGGDRDAMLPFLLEFLRWALAYDLAPAQDAIAQTALAGTGTLPPDTAAHIHVTWGLALAALGRWQDAVAVFDTVDVLLRSPKSALLSAQWRVLPGALGLIGVPAAEAAEGRRRLEELADDSVVGPRAAWSLAVSAYAVDDPAEAQRWVRRVRESGETHADAARLLDALQLAAVGDAAGALRTTAADIPLVAEDRDLDPFQRTILYLRRGEWQRALDPDPVPADWRWHYNVDFIGRFRVLPQAAEIDWAFAPYARLLTARAELALGRSASACGELRRVVELWQNADAVFSPLRDDAQALISERCR